MAIIANIFIDQGTDFSITVDVTDSAGNVLDLTGYSAAAQIRKTYSSSNVSQTFTSSHNNAGGAVTLSGTIDLDPDPTNELQVLSLSNDTLYLSNGNYVVLPPDADGDATNELQILSNTAGTISISNGNSITLQDSSASNELQTLSNTAGTISISSGNSITLQDSSATNELQALNISGNNISISNGNTVTLPPDGDSDATNEIQTLSLSSNSLSISGSNSVTLPANNDNSSTNELQNLTLSNNTLSISNGNSVNLPANNDNSSTNELQTLTYQNDTLSISNGNFIPLPSQNNFSLRCVDMGISPTCSSFILDTTVASLISPDNYNYNISWRNTNQIPNWRKFEIVGLSLNQGQKLLFKHTTCSSSSCNQSNTFMSQLFLDPLIQNGKVYFFMYAENYGTYGSNAVNNCVNASNIGLVIPIANAIRSYYYYTQNYNSYINLGDFEILYEDNGSFKHTNIYFDVTEY